MSKSKFVPAVYPKPSVLVLNKVFQGLYNLATGTTAVKLARVRLEKDQADVPKMSVLSCLHRYQADGYILCTKNNVIFDPKDLTNDYDEFHLSPNGAATNGRGPYKEITKGTPSKGKR